MPSIIIKGNSYTVSAKALNNILLHAESSLLLLNLPRFVTKTEINQYDFCVELRKALRRRKKKNV